MATDIPVNGDGTYDEATWAEGGTYGATAYEANGIPDGTILDENTINTPRKHYGRWIRALRDRMYPSDHGLMASCMIKAGTWNVNGGTLDGTLTATWLFIDADDDGGVVVQFSLSAGSPNTFTANSTTYVALNEAGTPAYSVGTPVVTSGYVNVWTVVTDATEITSAAVVAGFPTIPTFKTIGAEGVNVDGTLEVDGDIDVTGSGRVLVVSGGGTTGGSSAAYVSGGIGPAMIVESTSPTDAAVTITNSDGGNALDVEGPARVGPEGTDWVTVDASGVTSALALVAQSTLAVTGDTTLASNLTVDGSATIGSDSADAHTVNGNLDCNHDVTIDGDVTIGVAETTTMTVHSDTTFEQGLFVGVPNVQATDGKLGYDGNNLFIGNGVSINTIRGVRSAYVISDNTSAATEDITGASVTRTLQPTDWVLVRVESLQTASLASADVKILIAATNGVDNVSILNSGDNDQAQSVLPTSVSNGDTRPNRIVVRWRPTNDVAVPANNNWTIYVRHGVSGGGSVTSSNILLDVWR